MALRVTAHNRRSYVYRPLEKVLSSAVLAAPQFYYIASGDQHTKSHHAYFVHSVMQINKPLAAFISLFLISFSSFSQSPAGKLFIIGGGDRPPALMEALIKEAGFGKNDYAVVLPMSGSNPDTPALRCLQLRSFIISPPAINILKAFGHILYIRECKSINPWLPLSVYSW